MHKSKVFQTNENSNLLPFHGELYYFPGLFNEQQSNSLLQQLIKNINWKQEPIKLFGKEVMQPRLTAWYANEGITYTYSGLKMSALPRNEDLLGIKKEVQRLCGCEFNSALLNYYRHGADSMGWHRDNEKELGPEPTIASVTFGATRKFLMRSYTGKKNLHTFMLEPGSCLLMKGESQQHWEHALPKTSLNCGPRINITFRQILGMPRL